MIAISIHIPSVFIGFLIGYIVLSASWIFITETIVSKVSERKTGKWITQEFGSWAECSECHELYDIPIANSNFCPNCGADMMDKEGVQE